MIQAAGVSALTSYHWLGIPIAAAGAVLLALGTLFQHRAVENQPAASGRAAGSMGGGRLQAQEHVPDGRIDSIVETLLARPEIDYIHVRDTEAGCFDYRIERAV